MINTATLREYVTKHFQYVPDHNFKFSVVCVSASRYQHIDGALSDSRYTQNTCGTVACVCGWLPLMFPEVKQDTTNDLLIYEGNKWFYDELGAHLLDLPEYVASCLFTPNNQHSLHPHLQICKGSSSVKEVSEMLLHFCDLADAEQIV